jgi:hypothetical protein
MNDKATALSPATTSPVEEHEQRPSPSRRPRRRMTGIFHDRKMKAAEEGTGERSGAFGDQTVRKKVIESIFGASNYDDPELGVLILQSSLVSVHLFTFNSISFKQLTPPPNFLHFYCPFLVPPGA